MGYREIQRYERIQKYGKLSYLANCETVYGETSVVVLLRLMHFFKFFGLETLGLRMECLLSTH